MSDILLVHGSCHGGWCWRDVVPALETLGHKARSIDLPGNGKDETPVQSVTLASTARAVADAVQTDTVVVAHSWAGFPASMAADLVPGRIARIIYLCAYVPEAGQSLADMRRKAPRQPLMHAVQKSGDGLTFSVDPEKTLEVFYHDCPPGTVEFANARLCPQAILPQETPATLGGGFTAVPKTYIRCLDDRTIPPEFQVEMTRDWPARDVFEMNSSHSPFFSDPTGLAEMIDTICTG